LTADAGAFAVTGNAAGLVVAGVPVAPPVEGGEPVRGGRRRRGIRPSLIPLQHVVMECEPGAFAVTGNDADLFPIRLTFAQRAAAKRKASELEFLLMAA
jgi:hypothetical protein